MKLWLPIALFSILWLDLIRQLGYTWETNEQYAFGWFVPFFALGLLFRRWLDRPQGTKAESRKQKTETGPARINFYSLLSIFLLCLLLLPLRVIHEINQDWPLITWPLTALVVALTLYAFHLAGPPASAFNSQLSAFSFSPWVRHFAFPVCFILVAVKWPYRIEHGLTQNLMQMAASLTVEIIGWFGVPAFQRGNLIEIDTGVLGVDEACSGIRSFQSTLMAALFLGELYRLRVWARAGLVFGGLLLAFGFNVVRTLILTWQASKEGLSAIDKWHDPAGFTITIACFFVLWGVAVLVKRATESRKQPREVTEGLPAPRPSEASGPVEYQSDSTGRGNLHGPRKAENGNSLATPTSDLRPLTSGDSTPQPPQFQLSAFSISAFASCRRFLMAIGLYSLLCIVATEAWYRSHHLNRAETAQWWTSYPTNLPSFQPVKVPPASANLLKHDVENGGSWTEPDGTKWSVYCFRWHAGDPAARMSAQGHRPEYCLVGSGHDMLDMSDTRYLDANGLNLPFRFYTFESGGRLLHVFFLLWEDGAETQAGFGKTKTGDRLRTVWAGRRGMGQQTLQIICQGYPDMAAAEQAVRERLPGLVRIEGRKPSTVAAEP
ncbi:MAG: exosortase/archaeosortase family protein [Verrucomicrobia bacterium]|nr:exosortase/archaeosortase family protein [Verrucomicrobiota bacterium]